MAISSICSIQACNNPSYCRGWCKAHYRRWQRHGDPDHLDRDGAQSNFVYEVAIPFEGNECLIWPFPNARGVYPRIWKDGAHSRVHRLVCEATRGKPPSDIHHAAQSCGNGNCCNPHHIRWATPSENQIDRVTHGTHSRGSQNTEAKLSEDDARAIKRLRGVHLQRELATMFNVTQQLVSRIHTGKSWAWLE